MAIYDFLIVGAGLFGSTFAYEASKRGKSCLVIEKREHIAGNLYCKDISQVLVHCYGPHIFHTSNAKTWNYITQFSEFNHYINAPVAIYQNELYNLPFNMNTFSRMWGTHTPEAAKEMLAKQTEAYKNCIPQNLEEQAIASVGLDIYQKLIKGYTEKQWGRNCRDLPASIITRIPLRFTYNNNYFNDIFQGVPVNGYNPIIEKMLRYCDVLLNTDYFEFIKNCSALPKKIIYTGMIDEFFEYRFGSLDYRSLRFEMEELEMENYQGNAVVNFTGHEREYTRIIEHKHFNFGIQPNTVITKEYPCEWEHGAIPCYPINDTKNNKIYEQYRNLSYQQDKVIFGGRLGSYKYYDMDKTIESALLLVDELICSE